MVVRAWTVIHLNRFYADSASFVNCVLLLRHVVYTALFIHLVFCLPVFLVSIYSLPLLSTYVDILETVLLVFCLLFFSASTHFI